ncbi:MAG: hypothetical protein JSR97_01770 [Verrucomicrobia bacterium]|nr:hypothetical protein [Verrucomicrobiota bacterium]
MCNAWNHSAGCTCGWGGVGHTGTGGGRTVQSHLVYQRIQRNLKKFVEYFSTTNPNAICKYCGATIFFYQNSYGSKVFFDALGKPWSKHKCYYETQYGYTIEKEITLENMPDIFTETLYQPISNQVSVQPAIKRHLLKGHKIVSLKQSHLNQINEYVINYEKEDFGLCFLNSENEKLSLEIYLNDTEYSIPCLTLQEAKDLGGIFPYQIGQKTSIELFKDNIEREKIIVYYTLNVENFPKRPQAFMELSKLNQETLDRLYKSKSNGIRLNVTSKLTKDKKIEFEETND